MTQLTTLEVLQQAKALLEDKNNWYQGWFNALRIGNLVINELPPYSEEANCWCALGACMKFDGENGSAEYFQILNRAFQEKFNEPTEIANDTRTHEEILSAFDRAIEIASQQN